MVRISGGTTGNSTANQPPVVAVLVPVHGQRKTYRVNVLTEQSTRNGIFVDRGSVTYGGVTYCSRSCPAVTGQSHGSVVPVTIVDVHYNAHNKKTATRP
jgi:hypothetical protein